jgi:hypothetical protein
MQDQLPLRHSEFMKVRDGFVAFLKKPAGTAFDAIIPPDVADKMKAAARAGALRQLYLAIARGASVGWSLLSVAAAIAPDYHAQGFAALLVGGAAFFWSNNQAKRRTEPEIEDLTDDPEAAANLHSLDAYKARIAQGEIPGHERLPDGTTRALSEEVRKAFLADHSSMLVISTDHSLWQCIPRRPIPMSPIWVRLSDHADPSTTTAVSLRTMTDEALFDQRMDWLTVRSDQDTRGAQSFKKGLQLIRAFRRPDLATLTFELKKQTLATEGFSASMIEKMHAGDYTPFNKFLKSLPLHEMP